MIARNNIGINAVGFVDVEESSSMSVGGAAECGFCFPAKKLADLLGRGWTTTNVAPQLLQQIRECYLCSSNGSTAHEAQPHSFPLDHVLAIGFSCD